MVTPKLIDYINLQISKGIDQKEITELLINNGWNLEDIKQAFMVANSTDEIPLPPIKNHLTSKQDKASELLKKSIVFYKQRFLTLFIISLIPLIVSFLSTLATNAKNIPLVIIIYLASIIIYPLTTLTLLININSQKESASKSFKHAWKKLLSFWFLSFITGLIIFSGSILLVIPGVIFMVWFSLGIWIFVDQNIKGIDALVLSRNYVKGNIRYLLKKWFFIFLICFIVIVPLSFLSKLIKLPSPVNGLISTIISALLSPIGIIYGYFIYKNIKSEKDEVSISNQKGLKILFKIMAFLAPVLLLIGIIFGTSIFIKTIKSKFVKQTQISNYSQTTEKSDISSPIEQTDRAKDSSTQNDAAEILNAYERYYAENQKYPWNESTSITESSPIFLDSSMVEFGIDILIKTNELSPSFIKKDNFVNPGTNGENKFWTLKTPGLNDSSVYVCYIPKSKENRQEIAKLNCLNNNTNPPIITPAGTNNCGVLSNNNWEIPIFDGQTAMFACVP